METEQLNAHFETLHKALGEENLDAAWDELRAILEYDAGHAAAWFYVGELAVARQLAPLAVRAYGFVIAINGEDVSARRMRAYALYWCDRYDEALEDLETLVRKRLLAPDNETVLRLRCDCYYGLNRYAWALDDASEAVTHFPGNDDARKWRDEIMRRCLKSSEDADGFRAHLEALEARERAAQNDEPTDDLPPLDPKMADWDEVALRCLLVRSLENAAREDEASAAISELTERFDTSAIACKICGEIYLRRRDFDRARYWTERAIAIEPGNGPALFQMGQLEAESARRQTPTSTRALKLKLQAARQEDEDALDWIQAEWDAHFGALGEINFRAVLQAREEAESSDDPRPSATDWDGIIEDFKSGEDYNA